MREEELTMFLTPFDKFGEWHNFGVGMWRLRWKSRGRLVIYCLGHAPISLTSLVGLSNLAYSTLP